MWVSVGDRRGWMGVCGGVGRCGWVGVSGCEWV